MPTTDGAAKAYIIDCDGLVTIANTTNNALRAVAIQLLEAAHMKVPTGVLRELEDAFEDEFQDLAPHIKGRVRLKPSHTQMIGSLASKANSGFKLEPYGSADWIAAAVAVCEGCVLVTTKQRKRFYAAILDCEILTLEELPLGE
jgi:hypothetical protein